MRLKSLPIGGNFAWMTIGNAVYAASQWGMVSVLARLGSPEIVGQYALGVAVSTPILALAQLNLRTLLVTDVGEEHRFVDYRNVRVLSLLVGLTVIAGMALFENSAKDRIAVMLVAMAQAVDWLGDIYMGLFQRHERMRRIAIALSLHGVLSVLALGVTVAITGELIAGLVAVLAVRLGVLLIYDAGIAMRGLDWTGHKSSTGHKKRWPVPLPQFLRIVRTALPLGLVLMIGSYATNVPRYFIVEMLGKHALGIFASLASLTTAANLLVTALGQSVTPKLARLHQSGNRAAFRNMSLQIGGAGLLLGLGGVAGSAIAGRWVLGLLFGPEYAAQSALLIALAAASGAGFAASLLGYAITAGRRFNEQVPLQAATIAATSLICFALVPRWGLMGAAAGIAAGYVVQILGELWVLRSILQEDKKPVLLELAKEPAC